MYSLSLQLKFSCSRWRTGFSKPKNCLQNKQLFFFWCLPWNIFCKCFRSLHKNIFKWKEIYTREVANIKDVGLQTSRHQNWNCKSIRHSLLPVKRRLGVATPPCKTGWRHPDGVMAVCRNDLWKYGRCFSAQEMERCLGSFYFKWEKRHHASFLKISGCVFDGSDLLEGVHIQMLTANSCNGIFPDLCGWYIFRKSLSHSTPEHRYEAKFLTFEHHCRMLLRVWSIEADLVDFTKVLSAYGKTHRWSATLHGLTALDSSTLSAETLMW